jgi:hypothetical protein
MDRSTKILLIGATFILSAAAQAQTSAQVGTETNGQASVQADQMHAQASGAASTSSSASAQSNKTNAGLSSGTAFNATLSSPVDSKKSKPGDVLTAHTTENVKTEGKTVLPKGTKLVGHIAQASARAKGDAESTLAITFDRAILKSGEEVPLNVAIQAMASARAAAAATDADVETMSGSDATGSSMAAGHGTIGGLTSTAGSATGSIRNTAATVANTGGAAVNSGVNSTTGVAVASQGAVGGLTTAGQLTSNSRGVFSMEGLNLNSVATNNTQSSVITSAGKNVHLDSGTRMLMVTRSTASATPNP